MNFQEMNLPKNLLDAVRESGYTVPTPIQEATIPLAAEGRDVLGCAQTGTGKTAAFVLPILKRLSESPVKKTTSVRPIRALILTPTRELAEQNDSVFCQLGKYTNLRATVIYGGVNQNPQVQALKAGIDILVATPGRLNDLIRQGYIDLSNIEIFVLDEADRMLDMGFIRDVRTIIRLLPQKKQTLLFSATMPKEVEQLALDLLSNPETVKIDPVTSTVDRIKQSVYFVGHDNKKDLLLHLLNDCGVSTALVFTRTKSNADQVVRILRKNRIECMAIHGNKSQNARQRALDSFKSGEISVLAATDIAARGIDISELPFVINYNIPEEAETYIHRIGRTGRAGLDGTAISICTSEELNNWRAVEKLIGIHVPVARCEWSVDNMQPTERIRTPRPPRKDRVQNAQPSGKQQSAPKQRETAQPRQNGNRKSEQNENRQSQPGKQTFTAQPQQQNKSPYARRRRRR